MTELTAAQIEALASRPGVNRIAVENFLGSLGTQPTTEALINLNSDALSYHWNGRTVAAIRNGVQQRQ
jgi:hypothetical protein